jgi:hypothetical protein
MSKVATMLTQRSSITTTNTATVNPNQEDQTVTQDATTIFGDNTVDLDECNVDAPRHTN